jgi:hypothetical protein
MPPPKIIFIVPYRNREQHLEHFKSHMKTVMEDYEPDSYQYLFVHQCDTKTFNRGAMKNIGFIVASRLYPNDYKNITFVFNDVDNMPVSKGILSYETTPGNVKHFYGYTFTLGGIVSIRGADYVKVAGFPNYWGWGYEDNALQERVLKAGLHIDRSVFYPINDTEHIIHHHHGSERTMNKYDFERFSKKMGDGLYTIMELEYELDAATDFVNVRHFKTNYDEKKEAAFVHDLNKGNRPLSHKKNTMNMVFS